MLRSLIHYRGIHVAVAAGAAVTTAVLTGALLVGDSMRGSLRDLTLDRLGRVERAVVTDRSFRATVADSVPGAVAVLDLRGAAVHGESGERASRVAVHGVDDRFASLFPGETELRFDRAEGQLFPSVVINRALAEEIGAEVGDTVLLHFNRFSDIPRASLMGDDDPDDVRETVRLAVRRIVPDRGLGRFGLIARQQRPLNAFVDIERIARALGRRDEANALLLPIGATTGAGAVEALLRDALDLEDYGLEPVRRGPHLTVESASYVLPPRTVDAIEAAAAEIGSAVVELQAYLANVMRVGDRELPYSMVTAVDPGAGVEGAALVLEDGTPAPRLGADDILLNRWAAADLDAAVGDALTMEYWVVGDREELRTERATFTVAGVVALESLAADRHHAPEYPGLSEADDIASWDPPFPVDLDRVRPQDEAYWDDYGPTPKAFLAAETGRRLWASRHGTVTSIRIGAAPGSTVAETEARFRDALRSRLTPGSQGFIVRDVRAEGLAASAGATDFAGLFIGFSLFLIVSAALLVGLLFALGVEQRAREIGLLLATGFRVRSVRARMLAEGGLVAAVGVAVGLAGSVGYAWLMIAGLRTFWVDAVGSTELRLHVTGTSLVIGVAISAVVVLISIAGSVWRLSKAPPPALLAGSVPRAGKGGTGRLARILAHGGAALAVALAAFGVLGGRMSSPGLAFGTAALVLVSGLAYFALWCRGAGRRGIVGRSSGLAGMAARNSSWSPGRSMLSVALVGAACFVIVLVAANRVRFGEEVRDRSSGTGGFALVAESDIPLHRDLDRPEGRAALGLSGEDDDILAAARFYPMRFLPGEDASCLNLYRPESPRLLGVPDEFLDRGGFTFQETVPLPDGATSGWDLLRDDVVEGEDGGDGRARIPAVADYASAMWILHRGLGDAVVIENEFGEPIELELVGLLATSVFQSELLIPESAFLENFPSRSGFGYFLIEAPFDDAERITATLESGLGSFGFDAVSTRAKLESYKAVEHTYLSTFQVLGGLGLLLGTVGLGIVMVRNVVERRGELATLRAFGFRRARIVGMVVAENAFLLVVGMAIGTVSALLAVLPRLAALSVPWAGILGTLAAVLLVGMTASAAAVIGAMRVPLLPVLKSER